MRASQNGKDVKGLKLLSSLKRSFPKIECGKIHLSSSFGL